MVTTDFLTIFLGLSLCGLLVLCCLTFGFFRRGD